MTASDLALLRRFEPILRLAEGERFLPTAVDGYIEACSMYLGGAVINPGGTLDLAGLATAEAGRIGASLRFVTPAEQHSARSLHWRLRLDAPARLSRVGLVGRMVDALFRLSLIIRGTVPAGVAAAAYDKANRLGLHDRAVYYGRVVRDGGWTVLHYQFFYAMNDWRSAFGGANDHEADWEQVLVYCDEGDGDARPVWLAYAAHDHAGDDLRRAWDDPEVTTVGEHPVVYVGGGSHASYFQPGEYITRVDVPVLRSVLRVQRWLRRLVRLDADSEGLSVPFVDFAPGDGTVLGPGGDRPWDARVLDAEAAWVADFRGLWGLDTADVTGGERAPAGPRFTRAGSVRQVWADPVGYAGLQKVTPPSLADEIRRRRLTSLMEEHADLRDRFEAARTRLRAEVLVGSLGPAEAIAAERHLDELRRDEAELSAEWRRLEAGAAPTVDRRAHLIHPALPEPAIEVRWRRFLNLWSALSAPLILGLLTVAVLVPGTAGIALLGGGVVLLAIEALIRGQLLRFLLGLGILAALVLLIAAGLKNWRLPVGLGLGAFALAALAANVRELLGQR